MVKIIKTQNDPKDSRLSDYISFYHVNCRSNQVLFQFQTMYAVKNVNVVDRLTVN